MKEFEQTGHTWDTMLSRLNRTYRSETVVLLILSVLVGAVIGLVISAFRRAFFLAYAWAYSDLSGALAQIHPWMVALIVPAGGLVVGLLMHFVIGKEKHPGVSGVMEAVALTGGRVDYTKVPAKIVAAIISIACGASVGPEDPSVQIGAGMGSAAGQWLHLSGERVGLLAAAGAGAGIAAVFNAPIAGVFFSLEIIMVGAFTTVAFSVVVITSVVSAIIAQVFLGSQPAFTVPAYEMRNPAELLLYPALGVLSAVVAAIFIKTFYFTRDWFSEWQAPEWVKPVAAGVIVGILGLLLPQVRGVGYENIGAVLTAQFSTTIPIFLAIIVVKMLVTDLSVGSGYMGGAFAPALFLGAMLGQAYGMLMNSLLPGIVAPPQAYAMVGMAAVLAGSVHAPLTAILLPFEMTRDYRIILPLMLAVGVSLILSQQWQKDSFYMFSLRRHGLHLERGRDVDVMQGVRVEDAMTREVDTVAASMNTADLHEWLLKTHHHGAPVLDETGQLYGIVTLRDVERALASGSLEDSTVADICTRDVVTACADDSLWSALQQLGSHDVGRLPVVSRDDSRRLVGVVRRQDIIRAYNKAIMEKLALQHRAEQVRLGALTGTDVREVKILPGSPIIGKTLAEIKWPADAMVASIRRGRRVLLAHGSTEIASGDVLIILSQNHASEAIDSFVSPASAVQGEYMSHVDAEVKRGG